MPFVDGAREGNLAATRKVWEQLAERLDALGADERELLRSALRNLAAGVPPGQAFMPESKRARGLALGRPRSAGVKYYAIHTYYLSRIDSGDADAEAKRRAAAEFGCSLRNVQRAIRAAEGN